MEENNEEISTKINVNIEEHGRDTEETIEAVGAPEDTILKKKPRTIRQQEAFKKCQEARKMRLKDKGSTLKPVNVDKPAVKKAKPRKKKGTVVDLNQMSSSSEDDQPEIIYIKRKKRKRKK